MKEHVWTTETVDGGPVGENDFWKCQECGASGGPVMPGKPAPTFPPFLAGPALRLPEGCDNSAEVIQHIKDLEKAIEDAVELLRDDDKAVDYTKTFDCPDCGYKGTPALSECACYDEYATYCTPEARGPGCFNGRPYCPVCENPDSGRMAEALMLLEDANFGSSRLPRQAEAPRSPQPPSLDE